MNETNRSRCGDSVTKPCGRARGGKCSPADKKPASFNNQEALSYYIKNLGDFPLLGAEKEQRVARQMQEAQEQKQILIEKWLVLLGGFFTNRKNYSKTEHPNLKIRLAKNSVELVGLIETSRNCYRLTKEINKLTQLIAKAPVRSYAKRKLMRQRAEQTDMLHEIITHINLSELQKKNIITTLKNNCKAAKQKKSKVFGELKDLSEEIREACERSKRAKDALTVANLRFVLTIAKKHVNSGLPISDLIQEGNMGLMRAIEKFDYKKGYTLRTYAGWWIQQRISRYIEDKKSVIRIPVHMQQNFRKLATCYYNILKHEGRKPSTQEIAEKMGMPQEKTDKIMQFVVKFVSLETPVVDGEAYLHNVIPNQHSVTPFDHVFHLQLHNATLEALQRLTPREAKVLRLRFGIGSDSAFTLEEVGKQFGLTRERIRQIEKDAIDKIRRLEKSHILKAFCSN